MGAIHPGIVPDGSPKTGTGVPRRPSTPLRRCVRMAMAVQSDRPDGGPSGLDSQVLLLNRVYAAIR